MIPTQQSENIYYALEKICQSQRIFLWEIAKIEGFSPIQIQFIEFIHKMPMDQCTVSHLAKEFDLTKATVSDSIRVLVKKGFLEKTVDKEDKRRVYLLLSQKAKSKMALIDDKSHSLIQIIDTFDEEQKKNFSQFLMELIKKLYDHGYIQTARMCLTCNNMIRNHQEGNPFYCQFANIPMTENQLKVNCQYYSV
ncbi:MAG: MarR family transcriptional regulator [Spirochaetes bacterium]|nr:MarR family transcriptional regulator [Spirochaetota bacterium]